MKTRNLVLTEHRENGNAAKLEALQEAARIGFSHLEEGRFVDVADDNLEDFVAALGGEAEMRVRKTCP